MLLTGQGCWLSRVAGWAGLLAGQGCWVGRVGIVEADYMPRVSSTLSEHLLADSV